MQKRYLTYAAAIASVLGLTYCSNGGVDTLPGAPVQLPTAATIQVPGISSAVTYSFDLGAIDQATNTYYVTDRTNKSIDVVNLNTLQVSGQFKQAFAGCNSTVGTTTATPIAMPGCNTLQGIWTVNNDASGPDGLDVVGNFLYVGDVNNLWVLNKTTGAVSAKVAIPSVPTGLRADEGCWDSVNNIYAISTPGAANPFVTFLDTTVNGTPTVITTVTMNDHQGNPSGGLEACFFKNGRFWVNNDGSTDNPDGEANSIPVAAIVALKAGAPHVNVFQGPGTPVAPACATAAPGYYPAPRVGTVGQLVCDAGTPGTIVYPLISGCTPTGIAPGPGNELGTMCRPSPPARLDFVILDTTTGLILHQMAGLGGGDQITYDATSQRWFLANSRHTGDGMSCGAGSASCPLLPSLTVVHDDGIAAPTLVHHTNNGNNAHSVAVHSGLGLVITPFSNNNANGGGAAFPGGGINVFRATQ